MRRRRKTEKEKGEIFVKEKKLFCEGEVNAKGKGVKYFLAEEKKNRRGKGGKYFAKENTFMWRRRKMAKEKEEIIMEEEKLLQTVQVDGNPRLFKRSSRT